MLYKQYVVVLDGFLTEEEVNYIHGYTYKLPVIEGRLGYGGQDKDGIQHREDSPLISGSIMNPTPTSTKY